MPVVPSAKPPPGRGALGAVVSSGATASLSNMRLLELVELDPVLDAALGPSDRALAARVAVPTLPLARRDVVDESTLEVRGDRVAAAYVLTGAVLREARIGVRRTVQLRGPGDYVLLRPPSAGAFPVESRLSAYSDVRLALITQRTLRAAAPAPTLVTELVRCAGQEGETGRILHAIAQLPRMEDRLLALLWFLADRFGRVTPRGVRVPLTLTHQLLADLVGGRRPTVSLALSALRAEGSVAFDTGDGWYLTPGSRETIAAAGAPHLRDFVQDAA